MANSIVSQSAWRKNHARLHGTTECLLVILVPAAGLEPATP